MVKHFPNNRFGAYYRAVRANNFINLGRRGEAEGILKECLAKVGEDNALSTEIKKFLARL